MKHIFIFLLTGSLFTSFCQFMSILHYNDDTHGHGLAVVCVCVCVCVYVCALSPCVS